VYSFTFEVRLFLDRIRSLDQLKLNLASAHYTRRKQLPLKQNPIVVVAMAFVADAVNAGAGYDLSRLIPAFCHSCAALSGRHAMTF